MGTRHWPEDADECVEALEKRISELEEELRKSRLSTKEFKVKTAGLQRQNNAKADRIKELEEEARL